MHRWGRKDDLVVDAITDEDSDVTTFDRSVGRSADFPAWSKELKTVWYRADQLRDNRNHLS